MPLMVKRRLSIRSPLLPHLHGIQCLLTMVRLTPHRRFPIQAIFGDQTPTELTGSLQIHLFLVGLRAERPFVATKLQLQFTTLMER